MLANTLSLDDEEAVQAELRELEAEAVGYISRFHYYRPSDFVTLSLQLRPIAFPVAPQVKPLEQDDEEPVEAVAARERPKVALEA